MTNRYYAHTVEGKDEKNWHKLEDHLYAVAELAGDFAAEKFGQISLVATDLIDKLPGAFKSLKA